ncbi:DUF6879 family protein [Streptomyces sp. NPDC090108]|uniref:DUF6879 family protein n=1 Tax=Streptomyces sp. NPDC090108 TaxID=3365947 RepID=UPI0037F35F4D
MTQSLDSFAGLLRSAERSAVHLETRDVYAIAAEDERFYEHALSFTGVAAGEEVRRPPRREESELARPGDDFWLSDERLVQFDVVDGDGHWVGTRSHSGWNHHTVATMQRKRPLRPRTVVLAGETAWICR